jgi:lipoprotein-anchoring transpeptidase ErfK/SrfK
MVLGATLMLMLSASLAWAVVNDYQVRGLVPKGVIVAGTDLSGMTVDQARAAMEAAVSTPMLRPVTVTAGKGTWTLEPKNFVAVDVDSMLKEAYATRRSASLVTRIDSELRGTPLPAEIKPAYTVNTAAITDWVAQTSKSIDRKPKDATRTLVLSKYAFKITPSVKGQKVDRAKSEATIVTALGADAALSGSARTVALTVVPKKPKVVASDFKGGIIVSLAQCKVRLYHGDKLVKTYSCAPGRPGFPTPTGDFHVQSKQTNAPWINPGSAWAASMPAMIPGGPNNPMGQRKIGINYPGVFFHGVPPGEYSSIGTHASHGCMRMMPSAVLDLYGRVKILDPVYIRQ